MSSQNGPTSKLCVCYPCALRMSTISLSAVCGPSAASFPKAVLTAPPTQLEISNRVLGEHAFVLVTSHHPVFDIIYENNNLLQRSVTSSPNLGNEGASTQLISMDSELLLERNGLHHPTCAACRGLYQYLDGYYMPRTAEEVRRSPYLDSEDISVNVNVPRGFSFVWLAAAAEYLRGAIAAHNKSIGSSNAAAVTTQQRLPAFPEDYSSFKDMYSPDVRARIMSRLSKPEAESQEVGSKRQREEYDVTPNDRPRCSQGFNYSLAGTSGIIVDIHAQLDTAEALTGEGGAPDQQGWHNQSTGRQQHEQHKERSSAILPKEWCTNKGSAAGVPLQLFIIDDFVAPYLLKEDVIWKGRSFTGPQDLQQMDSGDTPSTPAQWMCLQERDQWSYVIEAPTNLLSSSSAPSHMAPVNCTVRHASVFIMGKYCKYMRGMSQSPWFSDGHRIGSFPLSLQEYIANPILPLLFPFGIPKAVAPSGTPAARATAAAALVRQLEDNAAPSHVATLKAAFNKERSGVAGPVDLSTGAPLPSGDVVKAELCGGVTHKTFLGSPTQSIDPALIAMHHVLGYGHYKFHTAGREDVDVRMLGTGRPFVLEFISPHKEKIDFNAAKEAVEAFYGGADLVTVEDMQYTTPEVTLVMSKHSSEKQKVYRAVVYSSRPITSDSDPLLVATNNTKELIAQQSTPLRVLHRRSLLTRPKTIHSINLQRISNHWLIVDLTTQAGTYIKEFVHGDLGRTIPNLGTLLDSRTDIIQLDVLGMSSMDLPTAGGKIPEGHGDEAQEDE